MKYNICLLIIFARLYIVNYAYFRQKEELKRLQILIKGTYIRDIIS